MVATSDCRVEAHSIIALGHTKWTVCYKVHVVRAPPVEYTASITLWPRLTTGPAAPTVRGWNVSRKCGGWNRALVHIRWYDECAAQLRRYGYDGS